MAALIVGLSALVTGCSERSRIERRLSAGDKEVAAGNLQVAETEYLEAFLVRPGDPVTLGRLGILYYKQGKLVPAYTFLEQAHKHLPADADVELHYALASFSLSRTADARAAVRKVLETRPRDEVALLLLAETCVTSRDNEEARRIVEELRQKHGDAAGYHLALGALRRMQRDLPAAEAELRKAIALDPKSSAAHDQLSIVFAARKDTKQAAASLQTASELAHARAPVRVKFIDHLVRSGQHEDAKKLLAASLAQAPDCTPLLVADMSLAFQERRLDDATSTAQKLLATDRTHYAALMQLAAIKMVKGDLPGVITQLKEVEQHYGRVTEVKYHLAQAHLRLGDLYAAEESLTKALAISPNYEDGLLLLAEVHLRKGSAAEAIPFLQRVLKRKPQLRRALVLLAQAHRAKGEHAEGLAILRGLAGSEPNNPDNHHLIGLALTRVDPAAARQAFADAAALAETHWPAQDMLIEYDLAAKQTAAARQRAETLVKNHPTAAMPWLLRARVCAVGGELEGAEADFKQALEIEPNAYRAYLGLAKIYAAARKEKQAVEAMSSSAEKSNNAGVYMQLGMLQESLGHADAAKAAYEKAITLNKDFAPALNNLAALLAGKYGDLEKAAPLARRAYERANGDPIIGDTLGWILFRQGQYVSALSLLQSSAEKQPGSAEILHHLALTHYYLGQESAARQGFERIRALQPNSTLAEDARARLQVLDIDPHAARADHRAFLSTRLALEPNDPAVLTRLGFIEARGGAPQVAAERLEAALKVNSRTVPAMVTLAQLYFGPLKNEKRGREWATKAHATEPNDGRVSGELGRLVYKSGDYAWAATLLQQATRNRPDDSELRFELCLALYDAGRIGEIEPHLKLLLARDVAPPLAKSARELSLLIEATHNAARLPAARELAEATLAANPDSLPALMVRAAGLEHDGKFREAKDTYERMLARSSAFAPATRRLALLYADQLGDDAKAEELALKARQAFADDPDLALALGSISYRRSDYAGGVRYFRQALRKRDDHAATHFMLGMALYHLKNAPESRTHVERALALKLPPQETTEAERVLEELNRRA